MLLIDDQPLGSESVEDVLLLNSSNKNLAQNKGNKKTKYMFLASVLVMRSMETLMISMTILQSYSGESSK